MKSKSFGKSQAELDVEDKIKAREIVQSVLQYGVNQNQILQIIHLFSMELEDINLMKEITGTITQSRKGTKSNIITGE